MMQQDGTALMDESNKPLVPTGYSLHILDSLDAFSAIQADWDAFLEHHGIYHAALTHTWLLNWLTSFPVERLVVCVIRDSNQQIIGLCPLHISRPRTGLFQRTFRVLRFIGNDPNTSDWNALLLAPHQDEDRIIDMLAQAIWEHRAHWDMLDLQFVPHGEHLKKLQKALQSLGLKTLLNESDSIPYLKLPATIEAYWAMFKSKTRNDFKRREQKLKSDHPEQALQLQFPTWNAQTEAQVDQFFESHMAYWDTRGQRSDFIRYPQLCSFYKKLLQENQASGSAQKPGLVYSTLTLGETVLCESFSLWQGNGFLCHITHYNDEYRAYGPGTLHLHALIQHAIEKGAIWFELGRGNQDYKRHWTQDTPPRLLWNLQGFKNPWVKTIWQLDPLIKKLIKR